jgi:hypothetical protein
MTDIKTWSEDNFILLAYFPKPKAGLPTRQSYSVVRNQESVFTFSKVLQPIFEPCHNVYWGFLSHTDTVLWTSDQPVAEASTHTEQHNIYTKEKYPCLQRDSKARSSNQGVAEVRLRRRGHWDRQLISIVT